MKQLPFNTLFSSKVRCVLDKEHNKNHLLAKASIDSLKSIIPAHFLDENNCMDLFPIAGNMAVIGLMNKNGDAISKEDGIAVYKSLLNKGINLEHKRDKYVGHIVAVALSKFDLKYSDGLGSEILTEEEAMKEDVFNLSYAAVLYKLNDMVASLIPKIIDSNDPTSNTYLDISSSWEVGFSDYDICVGSQVVSEAKRIKRGDVEFEKYDGKIIGNGGSGKDGSDYVYRTVNKDVIFLGGGLTLNPAGQVAGIVIPDEDNQEVEANLKEKIEESILNTLEKQTEKLGIASEKSVTNNKENILTNINQKNMDVKLTQIQDITDDSLKQLKATDLTKFIEDSLDKAAADFKSKVANKDLELKAANEKIDTLTQSNSTLQSELTKVQEKLGKIEQSIVAKEQEEQFNIRMTYFDETYDLTDDLRKVIVADIKDLDKESFEAYKTSRATVLFKPFLKSEKPKEIVANLQEKAKDILEGAKAPETIPNTSVPELSMKEKVAKAFALDQFVIEVRGKRNK